MSEAFRAREMLPGVWQIEEDMGVCTTLLCGTERALLVDTGYGLNDLSAYVRTITDKPLKVLLTHAHHDHALGARWFCEVLLSEADFPAYARYTGERQRQDVQKQALDMGLCVPADFLTAPMARPAPLEETSLDLGGLTARVHLVPGHTPGSAMIDVPERSLLLTGDNWNPCTWLFFSEALPAKAYRENLRGILRLPFGHVLCPHRFALFERTWIDAFAAGLTDEALSAAPAVEMGFPFNTHQLSLPDGQLFVFDFDKL